MRELPMGVQSRLARGVVASVILASLAIAGFRIGIMTAGEPMLGKDQPGQKVVKLSTTVVVAVRYPGMPAESMVSEITNRLERTLRHAEGVKATESRTSPGLSIVQVHFEDHVSAPVAMAQVAGLSAAAIPFFPPGTASPELFTLSRNGGGPPIVDPASALPACLLLIDGPAMSMVERADLARQRVLPGLASLAGVSTRVVPAGNERILGVMVDPAKLQARGLSVTDLIDAMENALAPRPTGTVRIGEKEMPLSAPPTDAEDLGNVVISRKNGMILLRDVSVVADSTEPPTAVARVDGRRQVWVAVHARKGSVADARAAVQKKLAELERRLPDGVKLPMLTYGKSEQIDAGLITLHLRAAAGARLEVGETLAVKVEKFLEKNIPAAERRFIIAEIGPGEGEPTCSRTGPHQATVRVQLADAQAASVRERIGKLRQRFREERAFDAVHASFHVGAGFTWPVVVYVGGGKIAQGEKLAQAVRERLAKLRPAADVVTAERIPSLQVDIDQAKAATLGVSLADIQHAMLLAANASTPSRTLHLQDGRSGKTYKVRVGTKEDDLKHIDQLGDIPVRAGKNGASRVVPLRNLATLKVVDTPAEIEHLNGVRVFAVRMNTDDADSAALIRDVESNLKELPTPNGMWIKLAR